MKLVQRLCNQFAAFLVTFGVSNFAAFAGNTLVVYPNGAGNYATIQDAVDAASEGDTIFLKSGVYETGGKEDTFATKMMNRVFIDKKLALVGEDREKTIIKGAHATKAEDTVGLGLGSDAYRCIGVGAANVVISNLTVTGGATHCPSGNDACEGNGGGIYAISGLTGIQIVDCIISNNIAKRAAGVRCNNDSLKEHYRCLVVRCWFDGNKTIDRDPIGRGCLFAHCLITRHFYTSSIAYAATFVNCTLADGNCRNLCGSANGAAYNCLFADNWYKLDSAGSYSNCTFSSVSGGIVSATEGLMMANCQAGSDGKGVGFDHFIAPPLQDYRLHNNATYAIDKGDATYLDLIPEGLRYRDFYGNDFTQTAGKVNVGCSQTVVTPIGGKVQFAGFSDASSVGGYGYKVSPDNDYCFGEDRQVLTQMKALGYVYADVWPKTVKLEVILRDATWPAVFGFAASGADAVWRRAYLDGTYEFCAPRNTSQVLTLTPKASSAVLYVKQSSTVTPETGTADAPYTDLQTAIDAAPDAYATIRVDGGTFARGGRTESDTQTNRVVVPSTKSIHLIGVGGPSRNIIVGERDTTDSSVKGMGPNGKRCLRIANGDSAVQGFTLTGGASHYSDSVGTAKRGAGVWLDIGAQALDCVISNNVARQGAAINSTESGKTSTGYAFRCLVAENSSLGVGGSVGGSGLVRSTSTASCLYRDNQGQTFGTYEYVNGWFNTYATDDETSGFLTAISTNYNCLVYAPSAGLNTPVVKGGVVNFASGAVNSTSSGYSTAPALVADPANGDYRIGTLSPALTSGLWTDDAYLFLTRDVDGNPIRIIDGKPVCGAVQTLVPTLVASSSGVIPAGTNAVTTATVTLTATEAETRPFLGFNVNGVTQEVAGVTYEYTIPSGADEPGAALSVSPIYDTNWYVDPTGDDLARGTAKYPKRTLKGGLEHAIAGDTVHVAAGTYNTLTMQQTKQLGNNKGAYDHLARAVVPEGVSLLGAGAESTFIVGANDSGDPEGTGTSKGCGPSAVRCVALGANARLSGFTLTGGRTDADGNADNFHGGGVLGCSTVGRLPTITDCIISNCVARRGGGAMFGDYNRCRFFENAVIGSGNGAAMRGNGDNTGFLRNAIIDRNVGWATIYNATIENCTFGARNAATDGATNGLTVVSSCKDVRNTLFHCDGSISDSTLTRCAYGPLTKYYSTRETSGVKTNDCCIEAASLDALKVDADYQPVVDVNIAIDCANKTIYAGGETDANGNRRFVNGGKLDVGAVEADWLAAYSKAIGRRVAVTNADGAVERIGGKVVIPSGATLAAKLGRGGEDRDYCLSATVADESQCTVQKDGEAWKTLGAGTSETRFRVAGDQANLVFVATGAGATTLNYLKSFRGLLVVIH